MNRSLLRPLAAPLLLVGIAVAAYGNTFQGNFQFDDVAVILENPHLAGVAVFAGHLGHLIRPALSATFLLDRQLYGDHAAGYHLLNLLLHLGSGLLVWRILTRATGSETAWLPFGAALMFLVHPVTTETVTYLSGRASGQMTFFYLLALLLYIRGTEQRAAHPRLQLAGAMAALALSIGSKETAVTFPAALLLWDLLARRLRGAALRREILRRHLLFWGVVLAAGAWAWTQPRYAELAQFSLAFRPLRDNLLSQCHAVVYALTLFVLPGRLNFDHDLPTFHSVTQWPLPADLAVIGGLIMAAAAASRRLPLLTFGLAWFGLQLLPTNSIIPRVDLLSERNLYLASIGLFTAVMAMGGAIIRWMATAVPRPFAIRTVAASLALAAVVMLVVFTHQRNALYRNDLLLWTDAVRKSPEKARPHNNLGHAYAGRGEWERAIEEFRTAVRLNPSYVLAQNNLRDAYLRAVGRE